ncbi:hypothetical protein [Zavarzinia compransoris]|nr:hypothetical protein [Zavarzinia compransoris]TDP48986.1 hypothetical protein DES42_101347 [Zavarzinia compransoris]
MNGLRRLLLRSWQAAVSAGGIFLAYCGWVIDGAVGLALFTLIAALLVPLRLHPRRALATLAEFLALFSR